MVSLEARLDSLNYSTQLNVIENLLDSAHSTTTFWGSRVVKVNGHKGSVYVDDIAKKILYASRQRCDADDLITEERISGINIVRKLQKFYQDTDAEIQKSNPLTKFFNWIREFSINPINYTVRPHITNTESYKDNPNIETAERNFRVYSRKKFRDQFQGNFASESFMTNPAFDGFMSLPPALTGTIWSVLGIWGGDRGAYGRVREKKDPEICWMYVKEQNIRELLTTTHSRV